MAKKQIDLHMKQAKSALFTSIQELREFLEWSKAQGIQVIKVGDVEVQFSALAMLPADAYKEMSNGGAILAESEPVDKNQEEQDMFWSSM